MNTWLPLLLIAPLLMAQDAPSHTAWLLAQRVLVSKPGLTKLDLPVETINASGLRLEDLRLLSPRGEETPYVVQWPVAAGSDQVEVTSFKHSYQPEQSVLTMEVPTGLFCDRLTLRSPAFTFVKAVTLEAQRDGQTWEAIERDALIFRQAGSVENLSLNLPAAAWQRLRITLREQQGVAAVAFTGATLRGLTAGSQPVPLTFTLRERVEAKGRTRLTVSLGAAHLFLSELRLRASDALFQRRASVLDGEQVIADTHLHRLTLEGRTVEQLELPVGRQISGDQVVIVIENGDSPPLSIESVSGGRYPVSMIFQAGVAGDWRLLTGNAQVPAPRYDIASLSRELRQAQTSEATAGPLESHDGYRLESALPETGEPGAMIDLKGWTKRREIRADARGVLVVRLDADVLAEALPGREDLRIVQGGRQVPYLIEESTHPLEVPVKVTPERDPKHPQISRWRLALPREGLPVSQLVITSPGSVFQRSLQLAEPRKDYQSHPYLHPFTSATWTHTPTSHPPLDLWWSGKLRSDTLLLETNDGDNAPIELGEVKAYVRTWELRFKTTDAAPLHLYYGKPQASAPRYDVQLVRRELQASRPQATSLADVELLDGHSQAKATASELTEQAWLLWAGLGLAVATLIFIMSRLLPKTAPETES